MPGECCLKNPAAAPLPPDSATAASGTVSGLLGQRGVGHIELLVDPPHRLVELRRRAERPDGREMIRVLR